MLIIRLEYEVCSLVFHLSSPQNLPYDLYCGMTKNTLNWSDTTSLIFYLLVKTMRCIYILEAEVGTIKSNQI
jgi:hypothetical protein